MTVEIETELATEIAERNTRWNDYVPPETPGRRYFSIEHDCISYTVVAESEAAALAMMPGIHALMCGVIGDQTPDPTWEETIADSGQPIIEEISGDTTIWDDGRDGLQHPINTYPLGTWASSEY